MSTETLSPTNSSPDDAAQADAFAESMLQVVNNGMLSLMVSIAHQTGLFDTMAGLPPSSSGDIAAAAGLNERYVRECLAALTVGGILVYNPADRTYSLPSAHAASLTRAAGPGNLASFAQYVALMASVEQDIVECFQHGGGVPYSKFGRFQQLMAEESAAVHDAALISTTITLVAGLVEALRAGISVADIGCGSGHAMNLLAREFPASTFTGFDFSAEAIEVARAEAAQFGVPNADFEVRDVSNLRIAGQFDLVCAFDAIHDQAQPTQVLAGIAEALKEDGTFLMVDIQASSNLEDNIDHPLGPALYGISTMHCMTVSLALGGVGLGTVWGEQRAVQMLREAGFADVRIEHVEADILNSYYIARKVAAS